MPKQREIPGTERPTIPALDESIEEYEEARDERLAAGRRESTHKTTVIALLAKNDLEAYVSTKLGRLARMEASEFKLKVSDIEKDES